MKYSRDGNGGAGITNITAAIPGTNTTVTLVQPSTQITITNYSLGSGNNTILYINFGGAATTASYSLTAGATGAFNSLKYDGPPVQTFQILGSAAADNYGIFAY
jgi:hypothetical protein